MYIYHHHQFIIIIINISLTERDLARKLVWSSTVARQSLALDRKLSSSSSSNIGFKTFSFLVFIVFCIVSSLYSWKNQYHHYYHYCEKIRFEEGASFHPIDFLQRQNTFWWTAQIHSGGQHKYIHSSKKIYSLDSKQLLCPSSDLQLNSLATPLKWLAIFFFPR